MKTLRLAPVGLRLIVVAILIRAFAEAPPSQAAPAFDLPRWGTSERIRLDDFAGQIVVLDFLAYWCAPCEQASKELETGVQQYYAGRNGNAQGWPVRVLSVNLEKDFPERTEAFLRLTGVSLVVNDFSASLLNQFGRTGIPFLVILDGSASAPGAPQFSVVYQHAGFEGAGKLRRIIDRLGSQRLPAAQAAPRDGFTAAGEPIDRPLRLHLIAIDTDIAAAADMLLTDSTLRYEQQVRGTQWDLAVAYATFAMDYRPNNLFDFFGYEEHLHEDRVGGQINLRQRLEGPLTVLGSAGAYDGYPDYRRVWIANRYRQKYDNPAFPTVPGYIAPDPKGYNALAGLRWEYLPTVGFAEFKLGYAHDRTAPGYEDSIDANGEYLLLRGREHLDTGVFSFSSENVLTPRLRALNEFTFTQTTGRQLRFAYQGSLNLALGEHWVVRGSGGVSSENPQFNAHFFGATVEYEIAPSLLLSVTGRYYADTGEIENSLLTTSAAPPLKSWEIGAGLRYAWRRCALKISLAPLSTNYDPTGDATAEFDALYSDRNWVLAQIAWTMQF